MSSSLGQSLNLSSNSLKMEEEVAQINEKQGIISILGSDCVRTSKAASLRRTLSADMSSKKWLSQNGFSPMKKIASSKEFPISVVADTSSEEEEEEEESDEIWASIQDEKKKQEVGKQVDIWSSVILSTKEENKESPAPYVHPLVKRSANSLSQRSLQICTESLGSETGSEGFSSYPSSESGDSDDDNKEEEEQKQMLHCLEDEEIQVARYSVSSYYSNNKASPKSFPPPLHSLSRHDGPSLRMHSRRENGRLVLEAVSVPTQNNFVAQRQDGRLLLTLIKKDEENVGDKGEKKDVFEEKEVDDPHVDDKEEEEEEEIESTEAIKQGPKFVTSGVKDIPNRGATMVNKLMRLPNRNASWANKFNEVVKFVEEEELAEDESNTLPKSLPPQSRVGRLIPSPLPTPPSAAAAASFNAYEYCWRRKPSVASATALKPPLSGKYQPQPPSPKNNFNNNMFVLSKTNAYATSKNQQEKTNFVAFKGKNKADYLVPLIRKCKEPRRSLLFWEPYCIATSS